MALLVNLLIVLQIFYVSHAFPILVREHEAINNRPIIGVMMQSTVHMPFAHMGPNYIAASYIKYLESSGARVVPIWNDLTECETERLFNSINGVLFPGGDIDLAQSGYAKVGNIILNLARKANDKGDIFPVWGTCLGHEYLSIAVAGERTILTHTNSQNITLTLNFTDGYKNSKLFQHIPTNLANFLGTLPSTANFHTWSVTVASFMKSEKMMNFYNVLSTSFDRDGNEFVSTMEGKKYPVFTTQWHPEKNPFEWSLERNLSHVSQAIQSTQYMSNFFVNQARLSGHKFETQKEEKASLIYNYTPLYTGDISGFEQCYFFKASINSSSDRT